MRLKITLLKKLISEKMTASELSLLLYCIKRQDERGMVLGVQYRECCDECDICEQSFYSSLKGLALKGIISYTSSLNDYDILIHGNDFSKKESRKEQYIHIDANLFASNNFASLCSNEKLIAMDLYRQMLSNQFFIKKYGKETFIDTYMKLLNVSRKTILRYKTNLKKLFHFRLKGHCYIISFILEPAIAMKRTCDNAADFNRKHITHVLLRRNKLRNVAPDVIKDVSELLLQYKNTIKNVDMALQDAIFKSLSFCKKNLVPFKGEIVHYILRESAGLNKDNNKKQSKLAEPKPYITYHTPNSNNKFNNFLQRQYTKQEMEELEKELLAN